MLKRLLRAAGFARPAHARAGNGFVAASDLPLPPEPRDRAAIAAACAHAAAGDLAAAARTLESARGADALRLALLGLVREGAGSDASAARAFAAAR
ncbi:MAG: hypothetical protein JNM90_20430, partial [Burkholderiales bacterium]|nr:hypothetical protein [Burkholderiales bacterium]